MLSFIPLLIPYKQHRYAELSRAGKPEQEDQGSQMRLRRHRGTTVLLPGWQQFEVEFRDMTVQCRERYPGDYSWPMHKAMYIADKLLEGYWKDEGVSYQGRIMQATMRRMGLPFTKAKTIVRRMVDEEKIRRGEVS